MRIEPMERYSSDPAFKMLVDILLSQLSGSDFTPTELREAAMVAAVIHETRTIRPVLHLERRTDP